MSNSVSQNLTRLQNARTAIANAITSKGGTVGANDGYEEFVSDIASIPTATPTFAFLFVTTDSGTTITVSKGQTTLDPQTSTSGEELCFDIPESGTWTVSESNGITKTVVIGSDKVYYVKIATSIYGVSWDKSSSTVLTRTDDAVSFSNPVPYMADGSHPGSSPFDNCIPWSGMTTETINGNVLVKIPKFWYKITNTSNAMTIQIADGEVDGFMVSPAHQDKGDGVGERDYVYIGRYKCNSSNYKSTTGTKPKVSITRATARDGCRKQGGSSNIDGFYQQDFAMFWTIRLLYIVEFANWNSQAVIGYGCGNGSNVVNTGATDSMPYHTGTMQSSRGYGNGTQYRYIEGLWDNVREWCDGIYFGSTSKATIYIIKNPNNFSDTSGGQSTGTRHTSGEHITDFSVPSASGYEWALYPMHTNNTGGENTYVTDYCGYYSSGVVLFVGGDFNQYQFYGMFYLFGNYSASNANSDIGCRLQYLP